ncbi:MAG TPA: helix-turn-helix transcriptional regulator [Candidatus Pelethocola excrementipullorum]|nr:helix-turn-helix transcriptional regulator [Candidatus Pelethocola excrementipullorum]
MIIYQADFDFDPQHPFQVDTLTLRQSDNAKSTFHWHSCMEIPHIRKGNGIYNIQEKTLYVEDGDVIIFNHMEAHGWEVLSETMDVEVILFPIDFIAERMGNFDYEFLKPYVQRGSNFKNKISHESQYSAELLALFRSILKEAKGRELGYQLMVKADILKMLTHLTRYYLSSAPPSNEFKNREHAMKRLEKVFLHMYTHFDEKITLEQMASLCYMSPAYFSAYFRKACNCTFSNYLNGIRIQQVQKLIHTTDQEIVDIAMECGFTNISNFYRIYKKYIGHPPGQEREGRGEAAEQ